MTSISKIQTLQQQPKQKEHKYQKQNNIKVLNSSSPDLLTNYLSLMANNNKAIVSFGYAPTRHGADNKEFVPVIPMEQTLVRPYGQNFDVDVFKPTLSDYAKNKIYNEASSRIFGTRPWPQIDNINAWMVTSETNEFKSDGGLGKVAEDLPNSFNKRFNQDNKNFMSVITPMYVNGKEYRLEYNNGKYTYHYGKRGEKAKEVKYEGKINVPMYFGSPHNTRLKDVDVRVFTTELHTDKPKPTKYIMLEVPEYGDDANGQFTTFNQFFNIIDKDTRNANHNTPYANSEFSDPVYRMAFFSKGVYELMKSIKEGDFQGIEAPNSVILNDWQAGSLAAMMHYTANAEADTGAISKETGSYFDETPTIYIVHNCEHQGATDGNDWNRKNIFGTLFGAYGAEILPNSKSWNEAQEEDKSALMRYTNFNSAKTGISLVDRVVPVSEYYAQELVHSNEKARGMMDLMKARFYGPGHTLTPITNGYSKTLIEPTAKNMKKLTEDTKKDFTMQLPPDVPGIDMSNFELKAYDADSLDQKVQNKNAVMHVFKQLIERERHLPYDEYAQPARKYMLFEADRTSIKEDDFTNTPVIAYSGRIDPQKGVDSIFKEAMWKFAEHNKNTPEEKLPVFILGGAISQKGAYDKLKEFKHYMTEFYPNVGKRIILVHGFLNTNLVAAASDMFLVPSIFEPCGLTQLEAMAKGSLPIATSTGGLVNTINDNVDGFRTKAFYDETGSKQLLYGGGFANNNDAYCEALERALNVYYNDHSKFEQMQKTAMQNDFSWDKDGGALDKYINLIRTGRTE